MLLCAEAAVSQPRTPIDLTRSLGRLGALNPGVQLDTVEMVAVRQMLSKVSATLKTPYHPLHKTLQGQKSALSSILLLLHCRNSGFCR